MTVELYDFTVSVPLLTYATEIIDSTIMIPLQQIQIFNKPISVPLESYKVQTLDKSISVPLRSGARVIDVHDPANLVHGSY